jgi:hypothetical protein
MLIKNQIGILSSARSRIESILTGITGVLQADLFDNELEAARHLQRNGHLRAAGTIAGVVLEGHLRKVAETHGLGPQTKDKTLNPIKDALRKADVIDLPTARRIEFFGDLRNRCAHKGDKEPTSDDVSDLIGGVDWAIKTIS